MKIKDLIGTVVENELVQIHEVLLECVWEGDFGKIPPSYFEREIEGMCSLPYITGYNSFTYIKIK